MRKERLALEINVFEVVDCRFFSTPESLLLLTSPIRKVIQSKGIRQPFSIHAVDVTTGVMEQVEALLQFRLILINLFVLRKVLEEDGNVG